MLSSMVSRSAFLMASQAAPRAVCRNALPRSFGMQSPLTKPMLSSSRQMSSRSSFPNSNLSFFARNKKELIMGGIGLVGISVLCMKGANDQASTTSSSQYPSYVQQRLKATYAYMLGGLGLTASTSVMFFRSGAAHMVMRANPWVFLIGSLAATYGTLLLTMSTPQEDKIVKHLSWAAMMSIFGLTLSPMVALGGPLLLRAAMITGASVGSLSLVAYNTPNDTFAGLGGPLSIGLGLMIGSSLAGMFIPAYATMAANISLYGGLGLFSLFVLYDTQKITKRAQVMSTYDPINESISLYLDSVNIFVRIAQILSNSRRK